METIILLFLCFIKVGLSVQNNITTEYTRNNVNGVQDDFVITNEHIGRYLNEIKSLKEKRWQY